MKPTSTKLSKRERTVLWLIVGSAAGVVLVMTGLGIEFMLSGIDYFRECN